MKQNVGVALAVKADDLEQLTYEEREQYGVDTVRYLQTLLAEYVGHAKPIPGTDFRVGITPPQDDPLQGRLVTVNLSGMFDTDQLPVGCGAYLQFVVNRPA